MSSGSSHYSTPMSSKGSENKRTVKYYNQDLQGDASQRQYGNLPVY